MRATATVLTANLIPKQSNNDAKPRQHARPTQDERPHRRDDRLQRDGKPLRDKQQQLDGPAR